MSIQHLSIDDIALDPRLQMREQMSEEAIEDYGEKLAKLPPCEILRDDDGKNWLITWHRFYAHKRRGTKSIPCHITQGTFRDALVMAAGENETHGVRLTNADKRKKVITLLSDRGFAELSSRALADICKVSDHFVESVRLTFKPNTNAGAHKRTGTENESEQREGADGRKQKAKKTKVLCDLCKKYGAQPGCENCKALNQKAKKKKKGERYQEERKKPEGLDFGGARFDAIEDCLRGIREEVAGILVDSREPVSLEEKVVLRGCDEITNAARDWQKRLHNE